MMISQGMVYGKQLDELIWREREKWSVKGFIAGFIVANVFWLFAVSL